jgi:hypothetical protein
MEAAGRGDCEISQERQPLGLPENSRQLFAGGAGECKTAEQTELDHAGTVQSGSAWGISELPGLRTSKRD